ncbi:MAG: hypothetical protein LBB89_08455 [Treponema sp.]|nr:hypothetical protein [Treponema sp.]
MARKREKKEKDNIDFRGLPRDEVAGQDGLLKQLTGKILLWTLVRGLWIAENEGAEFWTGVLTGLRNYDTLNIYAGTFCLTLN